jgi:hypothetical protein
MKNTITDISFDENITDLSFVALPFIDSTYFSVNWYFQLSNYSSEDLESLRKLAGTNPFVNFVILGKAVLGNDSILVGMVQVKSLTDVGRIKFLLPSIASIDTVYLPTNLINHIKTFPSVEEYGVREDDMYEKIRAESGA